MSLDTTESARSEVAARTELETLLGETFAAVRTEAFAYCFSILKDPSLAEDAVQSAFVEIHRRIQKGDAGFFAEAPWDTVKRNLRWASLKQRREAGQADRWFAPLDGDPGAPAPGYAQVEGRLVVTHILEQLPEGMCEVLRLRAVDQAPDAVSAAQLGISVDAFRCRYKRAVSAARAAARGLGIESIAGILVTVARRRWSRLRTRWLRGVDRTAMTAARLADVADNLARGVSASALGAIAVAVLAGTATPAVTTASVPLAAQHLTDGPPVRAIGDADAYRSGAPAQQRGGPATGGLVASGLPALPDVPAPGATRSAASETPEDTTFFTATPASQPGYANWILALGWGAGCRCAVLFESRDGGGSWVAAAGPPGNQGSDERISLPPSFPLDPRIFISAPAQFAVPSYTAPRFGAQFTPLPVPSGSIAVSPLDDRGDDRIFVAGQVAVWTYNLDTRSLRPVVVEGAVSRIIGIAAPSQPGATQLFVLADDTSPATLLAVTQTRPTLFSCGSADDCTYLSTPPLSSAASLSISPAFSADRTLEVGWLDRVAISHDGGQSFSMVSTPVQGETLDGAFLSASPQASTLSWAVSQAKSGTTFTLLRLDADGSAWRQVLGDSGTASATVLGAVASGTRVIALLAGGGLLCSADGGATWLARCPPA